MQVVIDLGDSGRAGFGAGRVGLASSLTGTAGTHPHPPDPAQYLVAVGAAGS